jgi:hypothetical protein
VNCDPDKLVEFLDAAGLSYKQNSVSFIFDCPRCRKKDKLYIRKRDGRFVCWYCAEIDGFQGRPEFALADLTATPIVQIRKALYGAEAVYGKAEFLAIDIGDFFGNDDEIDVDAEQIPTMRFPYGDYYPIDHPHSKKGLAYLEGRGISLEIAREYHLRFSPLKKRVVFPVEIGDRLVGWQERLITPVEYWNEEKEEVVKIQKVLSSKGIPTAQTVMFANRAIGSEHVVVCEGPIDAIKAHLCGGNICTMGKAIGHGQVQTIRNPERLTPRDIGQIRHSGVRRIYLALDPDAADETTRLIREFHTDAEVYLMQAPKPYKDLGDMPFEAVYDLFKSAKRVSPAFWLTYFNWK